MDCSGSIFWVKIAPAEALKRITGRILELVSNFVEASKKFTINIPTLGSSTIIIKTIRAHAKSTGLILQSYQKKFQYRDTILLKLHLDEIQNLQ